MWTEDAHCRQCGQPTILFEQKNHQTVPPNAATIEHVFSRLHPLRRHQTPDVKRRTLLCQKCNQENSEKEQKALGIEELRRRAQQHKSKRRGVTLVNGQLAHGYDPSCMCGVCTEKREDGSLYQQ